MAAGFQREERLPQNTTVKVSQYGTVIRLILIQTNHLWSNLLLWGKESE